RSCEDDVETGRVGARVAQRVSSHHLDVEVKSLGVVGDHLRSRSGELDADRVEAPAGRLEADGAGAGEEIEEPSSRLEGDDVEERLAEPGGTGPGSGSRRLDGPSLGGAAEYTWL